MKKRKRTSKKGTVPVFRVGHGFDVHRLEKGDGVTLGGVRIACPYRVVAHSDGDVLIHALCDALLGAAGLGDIGRHFPDTDAKYQGADSRALLREVARKLGEAGWKPVNADLTLIAEAPRIAPHVEAMRERLAADLGLGRDAVNVKATTTEGLGFTGRKEGIAAQAAVLVERK
ncbi:MAG: 2-C-methyl-D-erythritol 2,4-cyclodiphosphate synthase [Gammaproteobacteria bacterium]